MGKERKVWVFIRTRSIGKTQTYLDTSFFGCRKIACQNTCWSWSISKFTEESITASVTTDGKKFQFPGISRELRNLAWSFHASLISSERLRQYILTKVLSSPALNQNIWRRTFSLPVVISACSATNSTNGTCIGQTKWEEEVEGVRESMLRASPPLKHS